MRLVEIGEGYLVNEGKIKALVNHGSGVEVFYLSTEDKISVNRSGRTFSALVGELRFGICLKPDKEQYGSDLWIDPEDIVSVIESTISGGLRGPVYRTVRIKDMGPFVVQDSIDDIKFKIHEWHNKFVELRQIREEAAVRARAESMMGGMEA